MKAKDGAFMFLRRLYRTPNKRQSQSCMPDEDPFVNYLIYRSDLPSIKSNVVT